MISSATKPSDTLTAIATVRLFTAEWFEVTAGLDVGLKLDVEWELKVEFRLGLVAASAGVDVNVLRDDEEDGKDIDVALPGFEPMENKFIAPTPEQQVPLCELSVEPIMSQHINPPLAAHWFEQPQTTTPFFVKSSPPPPVNSSVFQIKTH